MDKDLDLYSLSLCIGTRMQLSAMFQALVSKHTCKLVIGLISARRLCASDTRQRSIIIICNDLHFFDKGQLQSFRHSSPLFFAALVSDDSHYIRADDLHLL